MPASRFSLKGAWRRAVQEYRYFTTRPWTLDDVGRFWDTVKDYDEINDHLATYYRRFTDSYSLAEPFLTGNNYRLLDIQARSGKGTEFWHKKGKISSAVCIDFSDYLAGLARKRLAHAGLKFDSIKVLDWPLPFRDKSFDFICSYETVEHICDYPRFIAELGRLLADDGILIITCPNPLWEWVHWTSAIFNIAHSEGPHCFVGRSDLMRSFHSCGLRVAAQSQKIFIPFNGKMWQAADRLVELSIPPLLRRHLSLRWLFVLKKDETARA